jgi:hypothetical protein
MFGSMSSVGVLVAVILFYLFSRRGRPRQPTKSDIWPDRISPGARAREAGFAGKEILVMGDRIPMTARFPAAPKHEVDYHQVASSFRIFMKLSALAMSYGFPRHGALAQSHLRSVMTG